MVKLRLYKAKVKQLKREIYALYWACHDSRVPWYAKVLIAIIIGYAASPIDLIPDFIPILGYLDDLLLIPWGIVLAIKLVPKSVLQECRQKAGKVRISSPQKWIAAFFIAAV